MQQQEFEALRARVERLEQRVRTVVAGWLSSTVVFMLLGVAVQQASSQPAALRARRIEIVDTAGRPRIGLSVAPDGSPALDLWGAEGRPHISLTISSDEPSLSVVDKAGRTRVLLAISQNGWPAFSLMDTEEQPRIALGVSPEGPIIGLSDAAKQPRIMLFVGQDGSPGLSLLDAAGRLVFHAP